MPTTAQARHSSQRAQDVVADRLRALAAKAWLRHGGGADPDSAAHHAADQHKRRVIGYLAELLTAAGRFDAEGLACTAQGRLAGIAAILGFMPN
ncbi:hypothetical protein [Nocardia sp. NPDC004604]|uniref:hypothetical protein n=1 Tax=Nocardia sp. NPDC004604 TaxID=3157013 RepID=UPI0033BA39A4